MPALLRANLRDDVTVLSLGVDAPRRRILLASLEGRVPTPAEAAMAEILADVADVAAGQPGDR